MYYPGEASGPMARTEAVSIYLFYKYLTILWAPDSVKIVKGNKFVQGEARVVDT